MKLRYVVALAGAALAVGAFVGVGLPQRAHAVAADEQDSRYVTVPGHGTVVVVPDRGVLSFGVDSRGDTAVAALAANSATMRKVIAALKAAGVAARDIQTSQVSVSADYADDESRILGYDASNTVTVDVRALGAAGALIDAAVKAGANEVNGPTLFRSDGAALARQALGRAVADARENAQALAVAAGVTLGKVLTISVNETTPVFDKAADVRSSAAPEAPPIEPGTQEIEATVTVKFEVT